MGVGGRARRDVVLIVEDDPALRMVLADLLEESGYETLTACNGAEALDLIDNRPQLSHDAPTVVLADIAMPEMNGYDFASALRFRQLTKSLPVILMSATARPMIPPGIHAFLEKPLKIEPLLAAIRGAARLAPSHLN